MEDQYAPLRLENQLCFPLYAASNLITRKYKPLLDQLDLTYTQYIVMMVLWEERRVNEAFLCQTLCLKSNTLTPLLKKLEAKGYVRRERDPADRRNLEISLTEAGLALREKALSVPEKMAAELCLSQEEAVKLYQILYKLIDGERERPEQPGLRL